MCMYIYIYTYMELFSESAEDQKAAVWRKGRTAHL